MTIDVNQLIQDIKQAASGVINQDITVLQGFSERQVKALAKQSELIAKGIITGDIDEDLREFFLNSLEEMARNFAKTLQGLVVVTIEKVWNAVVSVLWGAINTATGLTLKVPGS
ncbi:hypothetical protein [Aliikangiella sp. IMCC44359]|uniref:hypothetical protein n=1 Tax=Aliikangiella sp. IMCC44359 TaxID=3459125 RepID=UPI00403B0E42